MDSAVKLEEITKVYKGGTKALDSLSLEIERGKIFALLGPNGAGKTTLMRILTTQIAPTGGRAYVLGMDVEREGSRVRKKISYVPQETSVWSDITGYENLLIYTKLYGVPREARSRRIEEAYDIMGLKDAINKRVKDYSGGMIRRLEMACALITEPEILFLDEPTLGLDPAMRRSMWVALKKLRDEKGVTIFFTTHYMDEADMYADEMGIINKGKMAVKGSAEELKASVEKEKIAIKTKEVKRVYEHLRSMFGDVAIDGERVVVRTGDGERALAEIVGRIEGAESIALEKPALDDVFMKYTGARLDENNGNGRRRKHRD